MKISTLVKKLEIRINELMDRLYILGVEAQEAQKNNIPIIEIDAIYRKMAKIAQELHPVMHIVLEERPHLKELFDELLKPIKAINGIH